MRKSMSIVDDKTKLIIPDKVNLNKHMDIHNNNFLDYDINIHVLKSWENMLCSIWDSLQMYINIWVS